MSTFDAPASRRSCFDPLSRQDSPTLVIVNQRLKAVPSFASLDIRTYRTLLSTTISRLTTVEFIHFRTPRVSKRTSTWRSRPASVNNLSHLLRNWTRKTRQIHFHVIGNDTRDERRRLRTMDGTKKSQTPFDVARRNDAQRSYDCETYSTIWMLTNAQQIIRGSRVSKSVARGRSP